MRILNTIGAEQIAHAIDGIANGIAEKHRGCEDLVVVGIADGGIVLGQTLAARVSELLGTEVLYGTVDILFHRDDLSQKPIPKLSFPTDLPFAIEGSTVILTDDVLHSGRTMRAAINELFDQGRPEVVEIAVLFDRGNRRIPFNATYAGFTDKIPNDQQVSVCLSLENPAENQLTVLEPNP